MKHRPHSDELHEKLEVIIGLLAEILHQTYEHRVGNHRRGSGVFVLPQHLEISHGQPFDDADIQFDDADIPF